MSVSRKTYYQYYTLISGIQDQRATVMYWKLWQQNVKMNSKLNVKVFNPYNNNLISIVDQLNVV